MKTQKELIDEYSQNYSGGIYSNRADEERLKKRIAAVVELSDGKLYAIEKPQIQTEFCYAIDCGGIYDADHERNAEAMAKKARTDEEYFIARNVEPVERALKKFDTARITAADDWNMQQYRHKKPFFGDSGVCQGWERIAYVDFFEKCETKPPHGMRPATADEVAAIVAAYENVLEAFKKRLATYLKRYGLEKLHVWTYYSE